MLVCPICHSALQRASHSESCTNGHHFDRAKEGYLHLLPVQFKSSKQPGDSRAMMLARRALLDSGLYQPLVDGLKQLVGETTSLLDIGCGEGYYTAQLSQQVSGECLGIDISKEAIRLAAKRYKQVQFVVASSKRLPVADAGVATLTRIFAPCPAEQLARCCAVGGSLVTAVPGPHHLAQLKQRIYQQLRLHDDSPEALPGFIHQTSAHINPLCQPSSAQMEQLIAMTPFAWRISDEAKQQLIAEPPQLQLDFTLHRYQRAE